MFLKYIESQNIQSKILEKKLWRSYFWLSCRLLACNFFFKIYIYIYAGHFHVSNFFRKAYFKKHLWIAAPIQSSTFTRSTFHCIIIISISNDVIRIYWTLFRAFKVHYSISDKNHFTVVYNNICGGPDVKCNIFNVEY